MKAFEKMKNKDGVNLYKYAKTIIPGGTTLFSKRSELHLPDKWPAYFVKAKKINVSQREPFRADLICARKCGLG